MRSLSDCLIIAFTIVFSSSNIYADESALDKAVLVGDWQAVHDEVADSPVGQDVIYDFLKEVSCLALDLDCAPSFYETSPPKGLEGKTIEKWIKSLRRNHKRNAFLSYLMANSYSRSGYHKKSLKELKKAIKQDGNIFILFLARSRTYAIMNEMENSLKDANKAIRLNPDNSMAYTLRGSILDSQGKYQVALKSYANAIRLKPERAGNYYNRGNSYRHMNQNSEAISDYSQAIILDSTLIGAYFNRANAYFDEAELDEALNDYHTFVEFDSEEFARQIRQAHSQIKIIGEILDKGPADKAALLLELGFMSFQQNDYDGAMAQLSKSLALDSTKSNAYYWRAFVSLRLGQQQEAIDDFTQAIYYHPKDTSAFFNRGALFVETDRPNDAIRDFSSAIELNSAYLLAYESRAKAYESLGHIDSAITDYRAMLSVIPDSSKERRDDVKDLVEYLTHPNKKYDTQEIKKVVKKAYKLWEKQKWDKFANTIYYDDLERFQEAVMPFALMIFDNYGYVMANGMILSRNSMLNMAPDRFFASQMGSLSKSRALKSVVTIKFIEVSEIIPRGAEHAIARIRIKSSGDEGEEEFLIENKVELIFSGWMIRMPPPLMNVALSLGQVPKGR